MKDLLPKVVSLVTLENFDLEQVLGEMVNLEPRSDDTFDFQGLTRILIAADIESEVVLIRMPDGGRNFAAFISVAVARGVPLILPWGSRRTRVLQQAREAGARWLLTIPPWEDAGEPTFRSADALLVRLSGVLPGPYAAGEAVLLTSGTSGDGLSGCVHELDALLISAAKHAASVGLSAKDTVLVGLPLNFSYPLVAQCLAAVVTGAKLAFAPMLLTTSLLSSAVAETSASTTAVTPYVLELIGVPKSVGLNRLRMLTVGGSQMSSETCAQLRSAYPRMELFITYGLTEAGPRVSTLAAHSEPPERWSSAGLPLPGVEVELRELSDDGIGELIVKSDTLCKRYVAGGIQEERVGDSLATGDYFKRDLEGYLYFQDRKSDIVLRKDVKVSLRSVRKIVESVAGVQAAAATMSSDGSELQVVVDAVDASQPELRRLTREIRSRLLSHEQPDSLVFSNLEAHPYKS